MLLYEILDQHKDWEKARIELQKLKRKQVELQIKTPLWIPAVDDNIDQQEEYLEKLNMMQLQELISERFEISEKLHGLSHSSESQKNDLKQHKRLLTEAEYKRTLLEHQYQRLEKMFSNVSNQVLALQASQASGDPMPIGIPGMVHFITLLTYNQINIST